MMRWFTKRDREKERRDELLSAYLDGQLDVGERTRLEARLASDPALRAELEALRRTVALVRDLPRVPVPRNFILPQTVAPRPRPVPLRSRRSLAPWLTAVTSVAALLFLAVLIGDLLIGGAGRPAFAPAAPLAVEEQETVAVTREVEQRAWETPPAVPPLAMMATTEEADSAGEEERQNMQYMTVTPAAEEGGLAPAAIPSPVVPESAAGVPTPTPELYKYVYATVPPTQEEMAPAEGERTPATGRKVEPFPLPASRMLESSLGLIVLILGGITIWAWRARR